MEMNIKIKMNPEGLTVSADSIGIDEAFPNATEANTFAIGALEIAKASLLAQRWGLDVANFEGKPPLVGNPDPVMLRLLKQAVAATLPTPAFLGPVLTEHVDVWPEWATEARALIKGLEGEAK